MKSRDGKSQRREEKRREEKRRRKKIKKRESPKKQDPGARKGRKVAKHISKSNSTKHHMYAPLLDVEASFGWQAPGIVCLVKSEQNVRVL